MLKKQSYDSQKFIELQFMEMHLYIPNNFMSILVSSMKEKVYSTRGVYSRTSWEKPRQDFPLWKHACWQKRGW